MNKTLIVTKREYVKVVRKPTFWLSTLLFPVFLVIVMLISGLSATQTEEKMKQEVQNAKAILIFDQSGFINKAMVQGQFQFAESLDSGVKQVKEGKADALLYYPQNIEADKKIEVYQQDKGIFSSSRFSDVASSILKQSILLNLQDETKIAVFNNNYGTNTISYKDGVEVKVGFEQLIVPGVSLMLYIVLTTFATSYLLMSVSEEKENRIIEIVLSAITPRELITGKILGQVMVVITQVLILLALSLAAVAALNSNILAAINLSNIQITPLQIIAGLFYTLTGFFILACAMVGVGAAMPNYKDAQSFSSLFILLAMMPLYALQMILSEPSGNISVILSYIPLSSSIVLLFRVAMGGMAAAEIILSIAVQLIYCVIGVILAYKLFEFGSLEYNKKISFKEFFQSLKR